MDILSLNPDVLDATASIIEGYCDRQKSIMEDFFKNTSSLTSEWNDNDTIGALLEEIRSMQSNVCSIMDEIKANYPRFFREKAEQIRSRPKF